MKRFLKSLLDFLERKFPDRVVVKTEEYNQLRRDVSHYAFDVAELKSCRTERMIELEAKIALLETGGPVLKEIQDKLVAIQNEINKFNIAMGFMPLGLTKSAQDVAATLQR